MVMPYFELRKQSARGTDSLAADIMRHLHARQHLGKAIIVSDQPIALLAASRKQWLKLARLLQKQRASTLNADKILKYTHTIAHMQHMRFTARAPLQFPEADVYFLKPEEMGELSPRCYSTYITVTLQSDDCKMLCEQLPTQALVVDYANHLDIWEDLGLLPKKLLEQHVERTWKQLSSFTASREITISELATGSSYDVGAMEDALDTLLDAPHVFLQHANEFQHALELARPLRISKLLRNEYDALILLAHRVQALMPGAYSQHFLESYNEDDTFFLYERHREQIIRSGESLEHAVRRNQAAGRHRLAAALQIAAGNIPFKRHSVLGRDFGVHL